MSNAIPTNILKINSSGRMEGSHSRKLVERLIARLLSKNTHAKVVDRDLSKGVEFVDEAWIESNFTPADARTEEQQQRLSGSDSLIDELIAADTLVFGVPIYNFGVPATLKAWIDQIARVNRTVKYTQSGPQGLLSDKKAYLVIASGGTESGSEIDFATGYMRHVLGFIGISDVDVIAADKLMAGEEAKLAVAHEYIAAA